MKTVPMITRRQRRRPGTVALAEIRKYQRATRLLLSKLAFKELVKEVAAGFRGDSRFQQSAIAAIQEAMEAFLVCVFEEANRLALHAHRVTVMKRDIELAFKIRGKGT
jgi:histone H3